MVELSPHNGDYLSGPAKKMLAWLDVQKSRCLLPSSGGRTSMQ